MNKFNLYSYAFLYIINNAYTLQYQPPTSSIIQPAQHITLAHTKRSMEELLQTVPQTFADKPLAQLRALLQQDDSFSCGYRSLFHAQCISLAIQKTTRIHSLEDNLKFLLLDQQLLDRTFNYIKNYLDQYWPNHNRAIGLCMNHLIGVCAASIPLLHAQLSFVFLENDKKIYTLHDPTLALPSPLHYSADFIRKYGGNELPHKNALIDFDNSPELNHQLKKLYKPYSVAHFMCRYPNHVFVASIITDKDNQAKLYIIDSNNNNLTNAEPIRILTTKILNYVEMHNAKRTSKKTKLETSSLQIQD